MFEKAKAYVMNPENHKIIGAVVGGFAGLFLGTLIAVSLDPGDPIIDLDAGSKTSELVSSSLEPATTD